MTIPKDHTSVNVSIPDELFERLRTYEFNNRMTRKDVVIEALEKLFEEKMKLTVKVTQPKDFPGFQPITAIGRITYDEDGKPHSETRLIKKENGK